LFHKRDSRLVNNTIGFVIVCCRVCFNASTIMYVTKRFWHKNNNKIVIINIFVCIYAIDVLLRVVQLALHSKSYANPFFSNSFLLLCFRTKQNTMIGLFFPSLNFQPLLPDVT